jgi:hypothetical protein
VLIASFEKRPFLVRVGGVGRRAPCARFGPSLGGSTGIGRRAKRSFWRSGVSLLLALHTDRNAHARTFVRAYALVNGLMSQSVTPAEIPRAWS